MSATIYLIRHATPDWSRTDIPYDVPPGPPLTELGENEAHALGEFLRSTGVVRLYASPLERHALGEFLRSTGVVRLYASPLERTTRTAQLAGAAVGIEPVTDHDIAEWRHGEPDKDVLARVRVRVEAALDESRDQGPIGLVTHGGPIRLLLPHLGLDQAAVDFYRKQFDRDNPVPPAGVWRIHRTADGELHTPELVFTPSPHQKYTSTVVYV